MGALQLVEFYMVTNTSQKTVFTGKEQLNLRRTRTVGPLEKKFFFCLNALVLMVFKILIDFVCLFVSPFCFRFLPNEGV